MNEMNKIIREEKCFGEDLEIDIAQIPDENKLCLSDEDNFEKQEIKTCAEWCKSEGKRVLSWRDA